MSHVKDAEETSTALGMVESVMRLSVTSSASKTSWRRPMALRASAMELKDMAGWRNV